MRQLVILFGTLVLSACSHLAPDPAHALVTSYDARIEAALVDQRVEMRRTSQFRTDAGSAETLVFTLDNVPAGAFDLADMDSQARRSLQVAVRSELSDNGDILYTVQLEFDGEAGATPFGLTRQPRLTARPSETATVHLGQEAGEIYSRFTIDLTTSVETR